jgi:hypothetical protein
MRFGKLLLGMTLAGCLPSSTDPETGNNPSEGLSAALADSGQAVPDTLIGGFALFALGETWEYAGMGDYTSWDPVSSSIKQGTERFSLADLIDSAWNSGDSSLYRFRHTRIDSGSGVTQDTTFICAVHADSVFLPFSLNYSSLSLEIPFARISRAPGKSLRLKRLDGESRYFLSEARGIPGLKGQATLVNGIGMVYGEFDFIPSQIIQGSHHFALRLEAHNGRLIPP